jgi:hypothetical protein
LNSFKINKCFTGGRVAVVGSHHEVGAQAVEVAAVLRIVDVVLEKHFLHPEKFKSLKIQIFYSILKS